MQGKHLLSYYLTSLAKVFSFGREGTNYFLNKENLKPNNLSENRMHPENSSYSTLAILLTNLMSHYYREASAVLVDSIENNKMEH